MHKSCCIILAVCIFQLSAHRQDSRLDWLRIVRAIRLLRPVSIRSRRFGRFLALSIFSLGGLMPSLGQTNTVAPDPSRMPAHDDETKAYITAAVNGYRADPVKAKAFLYQAIKQARHTRNHTNQCSAHALLLSLYQNEGNIDSAIICIRTLQEIAARAPDDDKVQANYNQALGLYHRKNGNYKASLPFTLAAAELAERYDDKAHTAGLWLNVGNSHERVGDFDNAVNAIFKSLGLFEQAGNELGVSFGYNSIASIYRQLKQYDKALEYARKSLALKEKLKDRKGICTSLQVIALAYEDAGNHGEALANYRSALRIAEAEKLVLDEAELLFHIARIHVVQQKDSIAIVHFEKSKAIARALQNNLLVTKVEAELTTLNKHADSVKRVESSLIGNLQAFRDAGSIQEESRQYQRLYEFYTSRKQYDKALEYAHRYYLAKDSIEGNDIRLKLQRLEDRYESVKREKEIELLKKDGQLQQAKLKQQQQFQYGSIALLLVLTVTGGLAINRYRLRQRMKELELRNRIAADLHDEIGSSLSSISMLSQVAVRQSIPDDGHQRDILSRVSANARETMEKMSDIVWMIKPGENDEQGLLERMERYAYELCAMQQVAYTISGKEQLQAANLTMQQRRNVYLIFKEALNNAVKYSGTPTVAIGIEIRHRRLALSVQDHGRGFDATSADFRGGNGLKNMRRRAEEIGGVLTVASAPGRGTRVSLEVDS